ncbi:MAG: archaeal heat shock protein Hsp20 [Pyrodictiaceae archaeon]
MSFWRRRRLFDEMFDDILREFEYLFENLEKQMMSMTGIGPEKPLVYGVRITIGPDGKPIVEEFGNVRRQRGRPIITEEREPLVDVFEEDDKVVIVAELPGVDKNKIDLRIRDRTLVLKATDTNRKYYKEIELPADVKPETAKAKFNNGVLEITIEKEKPKEEESGIKVKIE